MKRLLCAVKGHDYLGKALVTIGKGKLVVDSDVAYLRRWSEHPGTEYFLECQRCKRFRSARPYVPPMRKAFR